jgi:hypothetical protein
MRGAPNFAERKERAKGAPVFCFARQNRLPHAPLRGAFGVLDRRFAGRGQGLSSTKRTATTEIPMTTFEEYGYEYPECPERYGFTYVIYSTECDRPEEVLVWCETDTFGKGVVVLGLVFLLGVKLRIDHVTLINEDTGTVLRYDGTR